jgi:hypothetical protein
MLCACTISPPAPSWIPYKEVHPQVRRKLQMEREDRVLSCNDLVYFGRFRRASARETDEIVIADGPAAYFDNTTGEAVADCSYWYCLKHNRECNLQCPVRAWVCRGEPQWK